jgi:hypothetical protein
VQGPIDPEAHDTLLALGLDVNVARPLVEGVAEQVVNGVGDVLVTG